MGKPITLVDLQLNTTFLHKCDRWRRKRNGIKEDWINFSENAVSENTKIAKNYGPLLKQVHFSLSICMRDKNLELIMFK